MNSVCNAKLVQERAAMLCQWFDEQGWSTDEASEACLYVVASIAVADALDEGLDS